MRERRPDRHGEMAEAAHLHVRPPVPPGELQAFPEVALGIVAGAGPELDGAEGHESHGSHVVRGRDLAHGLGLDDGLEQRPHLAHERAVVAVPAGEGHPCGRDHGVECLAAFFRHLRRMALRHGDVRGSGVERRPDHFPIGEECGQLGIGKRVRRESLEQRRHRCETAVERDAEAVLADEIAGEPPVRGRLRMADRLDRELVLRIPLGRGAMQLRDGIGLCAPQLEAKKIGEQLVVAEPGPLRVDGEDERIGILELEQDPFRPCRSEEPIGERSVHALEDRGSKEEPANGLGLALQDLGEQVVRHGPLAPREFGDEALWVGLAREREHREPESRRPSLRPGLERADGAVRESRSRPRRAAGWSRRAGIEGRSPSPRSARPRDGIGGARAADRGGSTGSHGSEAAGGQAEAPAVQVP